MKMIFSKDHSLQLKISLTVIIAIILIITDSKLYMFIKFRNYMETVISPFYILSNEICQMTNHILKRLEKNAQLEIENRKIYQELFLKSSDLLLLEQYKKENIQLRELLHSPLRKNEKKMITQVLCTNTDLYNQVIIDKGLDDGVYIGLPVINNKGVVGQVISTNKLTSKVLLLCDFSHAIPIQVLRNNVRMIIYGNGCYEDLQVEYLSNNIDIRVGDILITSGIANRFPEGYPVAVVSLVKIDSERAHTIIRARPIANIKSLSYLILLFGINNKQNKIPLSANEVKLIANKRLGENFNEQPLSS